MKINRGHLILTLTLLALGLGGFALWLCTTPFAALPQISVASTPHDSPTSASITSARSTSTLTWAVFPTMPATPSMVEALYQPFEHGFMVWRSDENCTYALTYVEGRTNFAIAIIPDEIPGDMIHEYGYCLTVAPLTSGDAIATLPAGLMLPTSALGIVWTHYAEVKAKLGNVTQPASRYRATIPATNESPVMDGLTFTIPQMTLPDGHTLACGSRGATAGTCDY